MQLSNSVALNLVVVYFCASFHWDFLFEPLMLLNADELIKHFSENSLCL